MGTHPETVPLTSPWPQRVVVAAPLKGGMESPLGYWQSEGFRLVVGRAQGCPEPLLRRGFGRIWFGTWSALERRARPDGFTARGAGRNPLHLVGVP